MRTFGARSLCFGLFLALVGAVPGAAQHSPPAMPPGMTPEIMKMMNTPLKGNPQGLPPGVKAIGGCIPSMGYHYSKPTNWPAGPIYGYYNGKPVFTEIMPSKKEFDAGLNLDDKLKPLPGYHIDHVDIWYEVNGHPGYATPHYDIHAWYIPHSAHMTFCKNPSGKRPVFV
jgi:hypothetical protein